MEEIYVVDDFPMLCLVLFTFQNRRACYHSKINRTEVKPTPKKLNEISLDLQSIV